MRNLFNALRESWGPETAYPDEVTHLWDDNNPSRNQCAVTTLVLQDYLGGEIKRGVINGTGSHYWLSKDDHDIDITWDQFSIETRVTDVRVVDRESILRNEDTYRRYLILREKVKKEI